MTDPMTEPQIAIDDRYSQTSWQSQYHPIADWDGMFRQGQWDYLHDANEMPRYAVIAGYAHRFLGTGRLLDVGCGTGVLVEYLDRARIDYAGFDLSEAAITRARQRWPNVSLTISSVEAFAADDGTCPQAIVFNEVLPHIAAPLETLDRFLGSAGAAGLAIVSLYQSQDEAANARIFTRMLEAELAAGRYAVLARTDVTNMQTGLAWRVYCLRQP